MAGVDVALKDQELGAEQPAMVKQASTYVPDPNIGKPTSKWARIAQVGAAKTQKSNILSAAAKVGHGAIKDLVDVAQRTGRAVSGAAKETVDTAKLATAAATKNPTAFANANKGVQKNQAAFDTTKKTATAIGNSIVKPVVKTGADVVDLIDAAESHIPGYKGSKTVEQNLQGTKFGDAISSYLGKPDNVKQMIGNAIQTGALVVPGAGKAVDLSGKFLLDQLGTKGVKDLAEQAGVHIVEGDSEPMMAKMADTVAKSPVGKQAIKALSKEATPFLARFAKSVGSTSAVFGAFSGGAATAANEKPGQIVKSTLEGAAVGAVAGGAGSVIKAGLTKLRATGIDEDALRQAAAKHVGAEKMANEKGLPTGETTKGLPEGKTTAKIESGKTTKGLPEGKPAGEAKPIQGEASQSAKAVNGQKVASLNLKHQQESKQLSNEFDQVTKSIQNSDHAVSKEKIDGYNSTRQLQEDHAKTLENMEKGAKGGQMVKDGEGGYKRISEHSKFYSDTFKDNEKTYVNKKTGRTYKLGSEPTHEQYMDQALKEMKSGKGVTGDTYDRIREQALKEADEKYTGRLDKLNADHEAAVKKASTPVEKGFTVKQPEPVKNLSAAQQQAQSRVSQLDKLISEAQKNGTTKSASELRGLMRERSDLQDVVEGKQTVADIQPKASKVTMQDLQKAANKDKNTTSVNEDLSKPEVTNTRAAGEKIIKPKSAGLGEAGAIDVGQASKDVKDLIAKTNEKTAFTKDLQDNANVAEGRKGIIRHYAAQSLKNRTQLSTAEKKELQDYIDSRAAGLTPKPLSSAKLQKEYADIIELNKAAQADDAAKARLEGNESKAQSIESRDPSSYVHRVTQGKGSTFDYVAQGDRKSATRLSLFNKSTSGSKARSLINATDENGERHTVSVANNPIEDAKGNVVKRINKQVTELKNGGETTRVIGSLNLKTNEERMSKELAPVERQIDNLTKEQKILSATKGRTEAASARLSNIENKLREAQSDKANILSKYDTDELNNKSWKAPDGHTYTFGDATVDEIQKNSGQKYYIDPKLTSIANYIESHEALENVKFIDDLKNHPSMGDFVSKPGETAPAGFRSIRGLPQLMGYKFDPAIADTLDKIVGSNRGDPNALINQVGRFLRQTIVYFPVKHDLNIVAGYMVDRGISKLASPLAYKRAVTFLVQATRDVMYHTDFYQSLQGKGFSLMSADDRELDNAFRSEIKKLTSDKGALDAVGAQVGSTGERLVNAYHTVQHVMVWDVQDILNIARIRERMSDTLLTKGEDVDTAMKNVAKTNLMYRVPARVGPGKLGSSLSKTLTSDKVFFGTYRYDLYKTYTNILKSAVNVKDIKGAAEAWDKLAATAVGVALVWPAVDKGLQKITGDPNAHMSAPGVLGIAQDFQELMSGKESASSFAGQQIYVTPSLTIPLNLMQNNNGLNEQIYDPYASAGTQASQILKWIGGQLAPVQKVSSLKNSPGNKLADIGLSLSGVSMPKDSPQLNKFYSLYYDQGTNTYDTFRSLVQQGKTSVAVALANQYNDQLVTTLLQATRISNPGKTVTYNQIQSYLQNKYASAYISTTSKSLASAKKPSVPITKADLGPVKKY